MSKSQRVKHLAAVAARKAIKETYELDRFRVLKFGRHADGYFHALVKLDGEEFYVHRHWGSWALPVPNDDPQSARSREVLSPFREALQELALEFEYRERQHQKRLDAAAKEREGRNAERKSGGPEGPSEHREARADAGVPD